MCYDDGLNDVFRKRRRQRVIKLALLQTLLLIAFVLLGGLIYSTNLGYSFGDSIYLAIITGSSVGFGDIAPSRTESGEKSLGMIWFTIIYIIVFVTFVLRFVTWISTEVYNAMESRTVSSSMPEVSRRPVLS